MRITIKDVAKLAGVSPSTVTRVVQNKPTISEETKQRVRLAMKELDYHPNLNARSLVSKRTQVIGLVLPQDSDAFYQNPFFPAVLRGISQIAADYNYAIQISTGQNETQRLNAISDMVFGKRVDGLIFLYATEQDPLVDLVIEHKFPFLILGKSLSPYVSFVDNDNVQAGFDATAYFIQQGFNHIAFLGGTEHLYVTQDRFTGYQKALNQHQIAINEQLISFVDNFSISQGYDIMHNWQNTQHIEAIVTTDMLLAEGIQQYMVEHHMQLPIVSFNAMTPRIPLSAYIDIHALELGRMSFKTLLQIIEDHLKNKHVCYRQLITHEIITQ